MQLVARTLNKEIPNLASLNKSIYIVKPHINNGIICVKLFFKNSHIFFIFPALYFKVAEAQRLT